MIVERTNSASSYFYRNDLPLPIREEVEDEEIVNGQIASPINSLLLPNLLSPEVLSFLLKERIKTQEYQAVTDLVAFDIEEAGNLIIFG